MPLALRYAARSEVGLIREGNEDSGYAGPQLIAVADGMGGHAAGEVASSVAIAALARLGDQPPVDDPLERLAAAVRTANAQLRDMVAGDPDLGGMGTTLTALLTDGSRFGLAHIGDSRGYLLRDNVLQQITHDHTFVQSLIDDGRISAAEADHHPQRALILRALDGRDDVQPDLSIRTARAGDRYLICSDGLSGVVSERTIEDILAHAETPQQAVDQLVELALRGGGPDNITAVVADVVDVDEEAPALAVTVGAAAEGVPRSLSDQAPAPDAASAGEDEPDDAEDGSDAAAEPARRGWAVRLLLLIVLAGLMGGAYAGWVWSQRQYYVSDEDGRVAIFRGLTQDVGPITTSRLHQQQDIALDDLPDYQRARVEAEIPAANLNDARRIVRMLRDQADLCRAAATRETPTAGPSSSPTSSADQEVPAGCGEQS